MSAAKARKGRRRAWLFLVGLSALILLAALWHLMLVVLDDEKCFADMRQIGLWVRLYAADHQGAFPDRLSLLYPQYVRKEELEAFVCPASKDRVGAPTDIDAWSSYEYTAPPPGARESTRVMLREKVARHRFGGPRQVLADGRAEYKAE